VTVDVGLDPGAQLELLDKLHASAVWLTDDEYRVLTPAPLPRGWNWRRSGAFSRAASRQDGAIAFGDAFGAKVAPFTVWRRRASWRAGRSGERPSRA
jgi:hypothetical protein